MNTTTRKEGLARQSSSSVDLSHPYYLHLRSLVADLTKAAGRAGGTLLDIGCGNKAYEKLFAERVRKYVGCDVVQSSERRVDVISLASELPFDDGSFDTVLCTQVIEHVADHRAVLSEAFRVLRPAGLLILSGPMYWPPHEEPYDFFRFTEHGLRYLLGEVGFGDIEIAGNGGKWALCGQVLIHTIQGTRIDRRVVVRTINRVFAYLDDRRLSLGNAINYLAIARRAGAP